MSLRTDRARRLLLDKAGWIEARSPGVYVLRILPDRRARVVLRLDESEFTALTRDPEPLFDAISAAIADLSPDDRDTLSLRGLVRIPPDAYLAIPNPPPPA